MNNGLSVSGYRGQYLDFNQVTYVLINCLFGTFWEIEEFKTALTHQLSWQLK